MAVMVRIVDMLIDMRHTRLRISYSEKDRNSELNLAGRALER